MWKSVDDLGLSARLEPYLTWVSREDKALELFTSRNGVTPQNQERRKRSGVEDVMYSIITMNNSKQATTSSIALKVKF